jgi:hypothetical protein
MWPVEGKVDALFGRFKLTLISRTKRGHRAHPKAAASTPASSMEGRWKVGPWSVALGWPNIRAVRHVQSTCPSKTSSARARTVALKVCLTLRTNEFDHPHARPHQPCSTADSAEFRGDTHRIGRHKVHAAPDGHQQPEAAIRCVDRKHHRARRSASSSSGRDPQLGAKGGACLQAHTPKVH